MLTLRQIEKLWQADQYKKLLNELIAARPEGSGGDAAFEGGYALPAAAMALVRMEELSQSHLPLYTRLLRVILSAQEADGGWRDPVTTAFCVRALSCNAGVGVAIERGLAYLAALQKDEGPWPAGPIRRMPADAHATAMILLILGDHAGFHVHVRVHDALDWLEQAEPRLDDAARRMLTLARLRCQRHNSFEPTLAFLS